MRIVLKSTLLVLAAMVSAASSLSAEPATGPPQRIVSINLCTDQILIDLVPRDRIAAVSHLASDPQVSAMSAEAGGLPTVRGTAEEVLALDPDLVIAGEYAATAAVDLLRRVGRRVVVVPVEQSLDAIRKSVRLVAEAVGEPARGEAVLAAFDRRLVDAAPRSPARRSVVAYQVNGIAASGGTLLDAAFDAAGLTGIAARYTKGATGRIQLESLVADPPDLVVLAQPQHEFRSVVADNLRHPALTEILKVRPHTTLDMPLWLCGTPRFAAAVERLAAARDALLDGRRP